MAEVDTKLTENITTYISSGQNRSQVARSGFFGRLTSLFGWRQSTSGPGKGFSSERTAGVQFVKVDADNPTMREVDAKLGSLFTQSPLSDKLEKLFDAWLRDSTNSYGDLRDRQKRIGELIFMYYNDPFISRVVQLVADEATQLDVQDRLISIESPDPRLTARVYQLLDQWGVTQQRVHGACFDLELQGEAFWANKVTPNGVEKIIPLQVNQILERLEFNPTKVAEQLRMRQGNVIAMANRDAKLQMLLNEFDNLGTSEDFAELFETKLFGYVVDNETTVPPWSITHFRLNADHSEFYPYGRPHLLAALAPFKQAASTMTLQSLARMLSFPVTLYKVKVVPGMNPAMVWDHVNQVREEYDNIGVSPTSGQSEVYSVNTKIWIPEGLLDVDVKKSEADIDFVGDLEMYIDRIAVASGVPKGYLVQEWGGWGVSAISLTEQFKPFARHVYTIQASFLEGLANLIRLHFVITGEFDYKTPFTLSMRFPAEEMSSDKRDARKGSLELATSVMELLSAAMGVSEEEPLPPDVIKDIMSKYTFLDPTDVIKWTQQVGDQVMISKAKADLEDAKGEGGKGGGLGGGGGGGGGDLGLENLADLAGGGGGENEVPPEEETAPEEEAPPEEEVTQESRRRQYSNLKQLQEKRFKEIRVRYKEIKNDLYFKILTGNHIKEFTRDARHVIVSEGNLHYSDEPMFEALRKWNEYQKTGTIEDGKIKTLREIFHEMKIEDTQPLTEETFNFNEISQNLDEDIEETSTT